MGRVKQGVALLVQPVSGAFGAGERSRLAFALGAAECFRGVEMGRKRGSCQQTCSHGRENDRLNTSPSASLQEMEPNAWRS